MLFVLDYFLYFISAHDSRVPEQVKGRVSVILLSHANLKTVTGFGLARAHVMISNPSIPFKRSCLGVKSQ